MKVLVEIDKTLPLETQTMVRTSVCSVLGVMSSEVLPDVSNDAYLDHPDWTLKKSLQEEFSQLTERCKNDAYLSVESIEYSLALGFALTKGLSIECARHFADDYNVQDITFRPDGNQMVLRMGNGEEIVYDLEDWDIETINPEPIPPEPVPPKNLVDKEWETGWGEPEEGVFAGPSSWSLEMVLIRIYGFVHDGWNKLMTIFGRKW